MTAEVIAVYYREFSDLIKAVLNKTMSASEIGTLLSAELDWEMIYQSDDLLLTDSFFALRHFASGEEEIAEKEWRYLLQCLEGRSKYSMEHKLNILA